MKKNENITKAQEWLKENNQYEFSSFLDIKRIKVLNSHFFTKIWTKKRIYFYLQKLLFILNILTLCIGIIAIIFACAAIALYCLKYNSAAFCVIITCAVLAGFYCLLYFGSFLFVKQAFKNQYLLMKQKLMALKEQQILNDESIDTPVIIVQVFAHNDALYLLEKEKNQKESLFLYVLWLSDFFARIQEQENEE